ncbi:MAG TPA: sugar transferase [Cyanobacteria bacterium UBA8543]|nr:sugar transferase [Cyanobacteria bacterium UBA8543]
MKSPLYSEPTRLYLSSLSQDQQQDDLDRQQQKESEFPLPCQLQWRQRQLCVQLAQDVKQLHLPSVESQQWLMQCLKHSPVERVCIDTNLGVMTLKHWADACKQAKKPIFLKGTVPQKGNGKTRKLSWHVNLLDRFAALLLLMALSPIMLAVIALQMYVYSPTAIFSREWCVGVRGKLFQSLEFRTTEVNPNSGTTSLGHWISKYNLHKLPQLFNILRGEMSLIGQRPVTLCNAVGLTSEDQRHLKALPNNGLVAGLVA